MSSSYELLEEGPYEKRASLTSTTSPEPQAISARISPGQGAAGDPSVLRPNVADDLHPQIICTGLRSNVPMLVDEEEKGVTSETEISPTDDAELADNEASKTAVSSIDVEGLSIWRPNEARLVQG
ncbi:hypothetical protein Ciccas_003578 [Cichlidogyrus casuarinus]|uniref:Uncharacterized protein n=1 Tax=Cichlidogyrus casuarinus TaxID=1844966 RepID=A0ABD2QE02_9PLAT